MRERSFSTEFSARFCDKLILIYYKSLVSSLSDKPFFVICPDGKYYSSAVNLDYLALRRNFHSDRGGTQVFYIH